jgi:hypothetical protein
MPNCPQCTKPLREITRRCPSCQADLDLLVDYVSHLQGGLERAENLVKAGDLGQAIWAYLEVLEVDPDNPTARRQISQVVTAVRQFDTVMPGRRWAVGLPPQLPKAPRPWWHWMLVLGAVLFAFGVGIAAANIDWSRIAIPAGGDHNPKPENRQLGPAPPQI